MFFINTLIKQLSQSYSMSKLILFVLIAMLGVASHIKEHSGININIGTRFSVSQAGSYKLECSGAQGHVTYRVDGLPDCARLEGDAIYADADCPTGNYILRIRAVDESGAAAETILTLIITRAQTASSSSMSSGASQERLSNVINSYSTVTKTTTRTYENNKFPETEFPTGGNEDLINLTPALINSVQAITSQSNRNQITADDVSVRVASQRHQNAVKGITNLLTIIDQARANRLYAKQELQVLITQYNDALALQRQTQNEIIAIETRRTQIISAIEGAQGNIAELKFKIQDIENDSADLKARRATLLEEVTATEKTKAQLLAQLAKVNEKLAQLMKDLAAYKQKSQTIKIKIEGAQAQLRKAEEKLQTITRRRQQAERDVSDKQATVNDLITKLEKAQKDLSDAKINLSTISEEEKKIPFQIRNIKSRINGLDKELSKVQAEIKRIQGEIDGNQPDDLTVQIAEIEETILENRATILRIDEQIAGLVEPLANLKAQLEAAEGDLAFLKTQTLKIEESLRLAYVSGNDANTVVAHAKENLDAANCRYKDEQKIISEATLNLERARAEEALARLVLEEIIAKYSDALPYTIVPNGNGNTDPGTPYGNNPAGSALGPVDRSGNGAGGSFKIKDWTHYLSQAFGAGVHPAYTGSVTELFPFNFLSYVNGHYVENNYNYKQQGGCGGNGPVRAISGTVSFIRENGFTVRLDNGEEYDINIEPCTKLNSNIDGYELSIGDEAITKGTQRGRSFGASQVTCLH